MNTPKLFILFISGAILGTLGDWSHVVSGTLEYPNPLAPIPGTGQPFWVPFLFGGATFFIGLSHLIADQELRSPRVKRTWLSISLGITAFLLLYASSGFLPLTTGGARDLVLMSGALLIWFLFDRTWQGILLGIITAALGTVFEISLSSTGAFTYSPLVSNLHGVPSWLPWLYVAASVATGNLGRHLLGPLKSKSAKPVRRRVK